MSGVFLDARCFEKFIEMLRNGIFVNSFDAKNVHFGIPDPNSHAARFSILITISWLVIYKSVSKMQDALLHRHFTTENCYPIRSDDCRQSEMTGGFHRIS